MSLTRSAQATADASGSAAVSFAVPSSTVVWDVGQISVQTAPSGPATIATVSLDGLLVTATSTGSGDTAIGPPNVSLLPGSTLTVTWQNAPAASSCVATLFYSELAR